MYGHMAILMSGGRPKPPRVSGGSRVETRRDRDLTPVGPLFSSLTQCGLGRETEKRLLFYQVFAPSPGGNNNRRARASARILFTMSGSNV